MTALRPRGPRPDLRRRAASTGPPSSDPRLLAAGLAAALGVGIGIGGPPGAFAAGRPPVHLVWHVESADGGVVESSAGDTRINPASVVKVATSLWALEHVGPDHRFETRFAMHGSLDPAAGVLEGDLLVFGGNDPDFHVENAFRVAEALNEIGLRTVRGKLLVDEHFRIGWEGGSDRTTADGPRRTRSMASRLRDALDPERWDGRTRRLLREFCLRNRIHGDPPRVTIEQGVDVLAGPSTGAPLLVHRSNPLRQTLKRFNAYSNNDIERLGASLGSPGDLASALTRRWNQESPVVRLQTLSGLGVNRMTARQVVRLLRDLDATCRRLGLTMEDVLPVAGCDPGTLEHFPRLVNEAGRALVAKTGSLTRTDGGVAVLAGVARTENGDRFFCVAAPGAGERLERAREAQQRWLLGLFSRNGGPRPGPCGDAVGYSDDDSRVLAALTDD